MVPEGNYALYYRLHLGPSAMNSCEPRQARKGATVAMTLCAGMWLRWSYKALAFNRLLSKHVERICKS